MPFKPKSVVNQLSVELLTLEKELRASGLIDKIDSSTLLVYSALKSGITDKKEIADNFFLSELTVEKQYHALMHVRCRILKIYRATKTKATKPEINITIHLIPDLLQQEVVEIHENPDIVIPIVSDPPVKLNKKDKLKKLQI